MNKLKKLLVSLCLVVCAVCTVLCFAGCRAKINNADIQKVLPGATGTYETITFEFDELKPEGFVAAYKVNGSTLVIKSQNVWGWTGDDAVYIYSAIRGGKYLNIVAEKTETRTQSEEADADFDTLVNELNALKNKDVKFVFNDSDVDKVHGYNYPKTLNCHYNVYKYLQVNPSVKKLNEFATYEEEREFAPLDDNGRTPGYKTPHIITYTSQILSHAKVNGENRLIVKTIPINDNGENTFTDYSPYCYVTMYICFGESGELKSTDFLEVYCSPNESCYHTESEFKTILGLSDFEAEHGDNAFISGGTITAGASWYGLKAAKSYINK